MLYILYAMLFLVIGGVEAAIIRIQLIVPHNHFVSPQFFNQMFTMHGTTMIFFVVMPVVFGFLNYLIPLTIGARDMAFPRLNAWSLWLTAFGGLLVHRRHEFLRQQFLRLYDHGGRCSHSPVQNSHALGFLFQFLVAGLTGIMLGAAPFNWQLSNSYFVVAHFHYVLVGGILFALFGAFYYWFPKISGRRYNEKLGKPHFWLFVLGFQLTFDFMHIPGILAMPRRIYTYEPGRGWDVWNFFVTVAVFIQGVAILIFVGNLLYSIFKGKLAGNDPWDAWTLEWSTASPPPEYNFVTIPVVRSRRPLWDIKRPEDPDWKHE